MSTVTSLVLIALLLLILITLVSIVLDNMRKARDHDEEIKNVKIVETKCQIHRFKLLKEFRIEEINNPEIRKIILDNMKMELFSEISDNLIYKAEEDLYTKPYKTVVMEIEVVEPFKNKI